MSSSAAMMQVPCFEGGGRITAIEKPIPKPGSGQLLLRCRANALCASDMGQYEDGSDVVPGHEAAGEVVAAGAGAVTHAGTRGVVFLMDFCGECRSCLAGATNQCLAKRADYGFSHDGGYSQHMVVNENTFFPVPDDLDLADATLLLDIMGTGGHAIGRATAVRNDIESLLIMGAGPIGLGVLAMAKLLLGQETPVLVADFNSWRLDLAQQLGGLPVSLAGAPLAEGVGAHGFAEVDVTVDACGKQTARESALAALSKRGVLVCVGHGEGLDLAVSPDLIAPERSILGSEYFRYDELRANLELLMANREYLSQIITHRIPIEQLGEAFATFIEGSTGKVVATQ